MKKNEFISLLEKTFIKSIFRAEQSFFIRNQINQNKHEIIEMYNGQFVGLFLHLRRVLERDIILTVAKMYDNPSNRYPTLCFKSILKKIIEYSDEFPKVTERKFFKNQLLIAGIGEIEAEELSSGEVAVGDIVTSITCFYYSELKSERYLPLIEKLKKLRNKKIAHDEDIELNNDELPSWDEIYTLIEFAKNFVGIFGWIFNTAYKIDKEYVLSSDAKRTSHALDYLLENLITNKKTI